MVFTRSNDSHNHTTAFSCYADFDKFHSVRFLFQFLPVFDHLRVSNKTVIISYVETELLFWICDMTPGGNCEKGQNQK